MASSPGYLKLGLTTEQLQGIAALSVENLLCQLQTKSLVVPAPSQTTAQPVDVQTVNMQADAESKRKAEEVDGHLTDESSDEEELKGVESLNNREDEKPPSGKRKVNREDKKERKAKNGKGAAKGTSSVQKTA